ncbi:MAG: Ig-like domain-containing protein [Candidatus Eisenbacteria bacterium]
MPPGAGRYEYALSAGNACGWSAEAADSGVVLAPPAPPTGVSASDDVCGSIEISWSPSSGAEGYRVLRDGSVLAEAGGTSYSDASAVQGSSYVYTVLARNKCGESAESAPDTGHRPWDAPAAPAGVQATSDRCDGVLVEWQDGIGEDGYVVSRDGVPLDTLAAGEVSFLDASAPAGVSLAYRVGAFNGCGPVPVFSPPAEGLRPPVPGAPPFVEADSVCGGVRLRWGDVAWEEGYAIERDGAPLDTAAADDTAYVDAGAAAGVPHEYRVGSFNACSGAPSYAGPVAGVRPHDAPGTPGAFTASDTICGLVRLAWGAVPHADSFDVYRDSVRIAVVAAPAFEDAPPPGTYLYEVSARNSCGAGSRAADNGARPPDAPLPPANPAASDTSCHFVLVTWDDTADEEGYRVHRNAVPIATLPAGSISYQDGGVESGETHAYRIEAFNSCGGSLSDEVTGERILGYPDPPDDVSASDALCESVFVSWSHPGAPGQIDSFQVLFRASGGGPGWTRAGVVPPDAGPSFGFGHAQTPGLWEYRVAAFSSCGPSPESEGSVDGAAALTIPSAPSSLAASESLCTRVELGWFASADADTYVVFRDGAEIAKVLAPGLSHVDTPVSGTHLYALRAANRCGRSGAATATGYARPLPAAPWNVSASTDSCGLIRIEWEGAPSDTGYYLYRDGAPLGGTPEGVTFFRDTGAAPGPHAYRVGALDECGRSDSVAANGIRPPDAPAAPGAVSASDAVCGAVLLEWSAVLNADSFDVYRDSFRIATTAGTALQDAPPPGTYLYEVSARNSCGAGPRRSDAGTRPPDAPSAPSGIAATDTVCGAIKVSWSAAANAEGYRVFRDGLFLAEADTEFHTDLSAAAGSSYAYTVSAWNGCGESGESAPEIGRRPWNAPAAPADAAASSGRCDGVLVTWGDGIGEEGYVVDRNGAALDTLDAGETSYLDASAPGGVSLSYRVGAFNRCGPVPNFSPPAAGFRLPVPAAPASLEADSVCGGVRIRWADVSWEDGYAVVRDGGVIDTVGADATEYVDNAPAPGSSHEYAVGSFNACSGAPSYAGPVTGVRPYDAPPAPANVAATDDLCGEIRISWNAAAHADSYRVFRNGSPIGTVAGTSLVDGMAPPGTYAYTIAARNSCGESSASVPDAGTRRPAAPLAPSGPAASDTSCHFILVTWGDVENEQGYKVHRDGQPVADLAANATLFRDAFVASGTQHSYRIQSYNACGSSFSAAVVGERILGYPDSPVQVSATDGLCDRIRVGWVFTGGDVDSFTVSYRDTAELGWTRAGSAPRPARTFDHFPPAGTYEYLLQAHNSCGASPEAVWSKDVGTRPSAPAAPSFLSSSDREVCGAREFWLLWKRVGGATGYVVLEGSDEHDVGTDTVYTATKTAEGTYSFRVRARNACGASAPSDAWEVDVQAGALAPTGVSISDGSCGAIRISWAPSSSSDVWIESGGDRVYLSGVSSSTDTLPGGGSRSYAIGGWNSCDTLEAAAEGTGFAYPLAVAAPVGVEATRGLCDSVRITWSYFPEQAGVDSFRVLRTDGPITSTVAVVSADAPREAVDRNVSAGMLYLYRVRAENPCATAASLSDTGFAYARPGSVTWNAPASAACVGEPFRLRWNAAGNADSYEVRKNDVPVDTVIARELILIDTVPGVHRFRIAAMNDCGYGTPSEPWTVTVSMPPLPPSGVRLDTSFCDSVVVHWSPQVDSVRVYRSDRAEAIWKGPGNGRVVDRPTRAVTYRVHGFNGCGESDGGEAVLARPRIRPAAPSTVTATDAFCDSVIITWSFAPSTIPVEWIEVVRSRNDTIILVASPLGPTVRRFVDRGGAGTYRYEVVARNACGASQGGTTSSDQGGFLPDVGQVVFVSSSDSAACVGGTLALRWIVVPGALFYRILEDVGGAERVVEIVDDGSRDRTSLPAGSPGARVFRVQAVGVCGAGPRSEDYEIVVYSLPIPPSGFAATTDLCGEVRLTWDPPGNPVGVVRVYRDGEPVGSAAGSEGVFIDRAVTEGVAYAYTAAGENLCGVSSQTTAVEGSSRPGLAPPAPTSPPDGASGLPIPVRLAWGAVDGAEGYALRVEEPGSGAVIADTLLPPDPAFLLASLGIGDTYRWRVATRSVCGVGVPSAWRTFATLSIAPSALSSDPADGEDDVAVDAVIRVTFSVPLDPAFLSGVKLYFGTSEVEGNRSLESGGNRLVFAPSSLLAYGTTYTLDFSLLFDVFGRSLEDLPPIAFTTRPGERPFGDMDGDYERDLADVDLAILMLLGLRDPAEQPFSRINLNGDDAYNVADLVLLVRVLVEEGMSLLAEKRAEPIAVEAHAEADFQPNRSRVTLSFPIPPGARAGLVEIVLPEGKARDLLGVAFEGSEAGDLRRARGEDGVVRILVVPPIDGPRGRAAGGAAEGRLALLLGGGSPPDGIEIRRMAWSDGECGVRFFRPESGGAVPVRSAGSVEIRPNRPNPFNPSTEIHYFIPNASHVRLRVLDPGGRVIAILADRLEGAGWHTEVWDGRTGAGADVASGVYFACLETIAGARTVRMTLVR